MKLYSDFPLVRTRQIASDVIAAAIIVLSIVAGVTVYSAIVVIAQVGVQLQGAGDGFQQNMSDAADTLGGVPLIGDGIRGPFDAASDAGQSLADAGTGLQQTVTTGAVVIGILVALVPVLIVLRFWLVRRVRFARRATVAATLSQAPAGLDLLALRALGEREARTLFAIDPAPVEAWRRGDPRVVRALADLALREAGVRSPGAGTAVA